MESAQTVTRSSRRMVIYCRISDDREGRQNGVDRQERQCRSLADRNGDEVVQVFVDDDRSAYSGKIRPDYKKMMIFLEAKRADGVYSLAPTRLYRRLHEPSTGQDALAFLDAVNRLSLEVETVKQGRFNLSTADGRRDAKRAALDAEYESDLLSERIRDGKSDNVREGTYRGGPRPFGYEPDGRTPRSLLCPSCGSTQGFTVDRVCEECGADAVNAEGSEAWSTEMATDAIVAGDSLRSICRAWLLREVRTVARRRRREDGTRTEPISGEWEAPELRALLLRPRNAGLFEAHGEITGRAAWAPIVSEEKWRACKAILEAASRRTTTSNARRWLGSGLYLCGALVTRYEDADGHEFVHTGSYSQDADGWPLYVTADDPGGEPRTPSQLIKAHGRLTDVEVTTAPEGRRGCRATIRCSTSGRGTGGGHKIAYRCRGGTHVTRIAASLDDYIEGVALGVLSRPDAVILLLPPAREAEDPEDLAARANALRARLDGYSEDYDADRVTRKQMLDGTARTREQLASVEARMAGHAGDSVLATVPLGTPAVVDLWPTYHLDKKRAIIDALMTVTVLPARRGRPPGFVPGSGQGYFDPTAIRIKPKH